MVVSQSKPHTSKLLCVIAYNAKIVAEKSTSKFTCQKFEIVMNLGMHFVIRTCTIVAVPGKLFPQIVFVIVFLKFVALEKGAHGTIKQLFL